MRKLESVIIILPCFAFVFFFLVCCYNITGVVCDTHAKYDLFLIPWLADMAKPDGIFDVSTNWAYIPSIGQTILTMFINKAYREVAIYTTDRENHKYQSNYDNSLILKRFLFEFSDCFLPLIYVGWWELNF